MAKITNEQILLGAGAVAMGGIAFFAWRRTAKASPVCLTSPYTVNESGLNKLVSAELDAGRRNAGPIAVDVATTALSPHPSGPTVIFPPIHNSEMNLPLPGVECAWELVQQAVTANMRARGIVSGADAPPKIKPSRAPREFDPADEPADTYPWERPLVSRSNWPTVNSFFIVGIPTQIQGGEWNINTESDLVRAVLESALEIAENPKPAWVKMPAMNGTAWSDPEGFWGIDAKRLRRQTAQLIRCSPWNDQLYGQTDPYKAGGSTDVTYMLEPSGRGLNWLPVHNNNINLIGLDKQPVRNTDMQGNPTGPGTSHMQLWIPAVNLEFLSPSLSDSALNITTQGMAWSDGSSTIQPPPIVAEVGVDTGVTGVPWGCP